MAEELVNTGLMTGAQLEGILNKVFSEHKEDITAWQEKINRDHECNFIMVDGYTAVLDISTSLIDSFDGCNGYYELTPEQYVEVMDDFGENIILDDATISTKQGLTKRYRFPVIINESSGDSIFRYRIVKAEDIKKELPVGSMMSQTKSMEMRMRRGGLGGE